MNPSKIGSVSEAKCLAKFLSLGWDVAVPFGHGLPYDLVLNRRGGKDFERVQVKTARWSEEKKVWVIPLSRSVDSSRSEKDGYVGEVELIAAYCAVKDKVFLVSVGTVSASFCVQIRAEAPKNKQKANINYASDFEI